jgi:hypothetical protein
MAMGVQIMVVAPGLTLWLCTGGQRIDSGLTAVGRDNGTKQMDGRGQKRGKVGRISGEDVAE